MRKLRLFRIASGVLGLAVFALILGATPAAAQTETIEYYGTDAVGSVRIVFNASGTVLGRQDYDPFGREILSAWGVPPERFGGQTADSEVQQEYFHARQFQNRVDRLTTPDFLVAQHLFDPQSLNRYSYALDNPEVIQDFTGFDPDPIHRVVIHGCGADSVFKESDDCRASTWMNSPTTEVWQWTGGFIDPGRGPRGRDPKGRPGSGVGSGTTSPNSGTNGNTSAPPSPTPPIACPNTSTSILKPDFFHVQFNAGAVFGGSVGISMDNYRNVYFSVGANGGLSDPISASLTFGRVNGQRTQAHIKDVLGGWSGSAGGGPLLGGFVSGNSSGKSVEFGFMTPQGGGAVSYTWVFSSTNSCS